MENISRENRMKPKLTPLVINRGHHDLETVPKTAPVMDNSNNAVHDLRAAIEEKIVTNKVTRTYSLSQQGK